MKGWSANVPQRVCCNNGLLSEYDGRKASELGTELLGSAAWSRCIAWVGVLVQCEARTGYTPRTGQSLNIAASNVQALRAGKPLQDSAKAGAELTHLLKSPSKGCNLAKWQVGTRSRRHCWLAPQL